MKIQANRLLIMLALLAGLQVAGAQPTFIPLYSFTGGGDGANPVAGLAQASDGNLYGTTHEGGTNGYGAIFRITASGVLIPLYSFTGGNDGANPYAGLVQASDGNLYGTTEYGGTNDDGAVFRITTNGVLTALYSFTDGRDGADPLAGLALADGGNLYGTAPGGGTNRVGTAFELFVSPPALNILSNGRQSVLSWPAWASNFVLQSTTNLASPNWTTISNAMPGMAVTVTNSLPAQFFRLVSP
jgi:uncharacterized repeat protein (TIGR03803 family)